MPEKSKWDKVKKMRVKLPQNPKVKNLMDNWDILNISTEMLNVAGRFFCLFLHFFLSFCYEFTLANYKRYKSTMHILVKKHNISEK